MFVSELNKIPATVSAPRLSEEGGAPASIFYLDAAKDVVSSTDGACDARKPRQHFQHLFTESGSTAEHDRGNEPFPVHIHNTSRFFHTLEYSR